MRMTDEVKKSLDELRDELISSQANTVQLHISINSQTNLKNNPMLQEWGLFDIECSKNHQQLEPNTNLLECIENITIATCQEHFYNSTAMNAFVSNKDDIVKMAKYSDFTCAWVVKLNNCKLNYHRDSIIIGVQVNSLPNYYNYFMLQVLFSKFPFCALMSCVLAPEIRFREQDTISAATRIQFIGAGEGILILPVKNDYERSYLDNDPKVRYTLPYSARIWSTNETWIEWNDLDLMLFDYSDVYVKMFGINVFPSIVWATALVFINLLKRMLQRNWDDFWASKKRVNLRCPHYDPNFNRFKCDYVEMNIEKFLEHMYWFISKESDSCYNSALFEKGGTASSSVWTYNQVVEKISHWIKMYQLAREFHIKKVKFNCFKTCLHTGWSKTENFQNMNIWVHRLVRQYMKIVNLLFEIPVTVMVDAKYAQVDDILHIVLELLFFISVFGEISLNTIKRLRFFLTRIITAEYVEQHQFYVANSINDAGDDNNGNDVTIKAGIMLSNNHVKTVGQFHYQYLDMYHTILIKLAFKQLVLTPLDCCSYESIQTLLYQMYQSYCHFIQERDKLPFIQCKHWFFFANEICWLEFLSGRISRVCKYGELGKDDQLTAVAVDNDIKQSLLKLNHAQDYCQLSSVLKFNNLDLIVKPHYLFQRIGIIKRRHNKYDNFSQYLKKTDCNTQMNVCSQMMLAMLSYKTGFSSREPSLSDFEFVQQFYESTSLDTNQFWTKQDITKQREWYYGLKNTFYEQQIRTCEVCGEDRVKLRTCRNCRSVRYCSRLCQKKHWKIHKKACLLLP